MSDIGRECGNESFSPCCKRRNNSPASKRASLENGGVLTSPCNQRSGLSPAFTTLNICHLRHSAKGEPESGRVSWRHVRELYRARIEICAPAIPSDRAASLICP